MATDPPINYLVRYSDKELLQEWEVRVARLQKAISEGESIWPSSTVAFFDESVTRVEQEIGRRNMPIPGDKTWK